MHREASIKLEINKEIGSSQTGIINSEHRQIISIGWKPGQGD